MAALTEAAETIEDMWTNLSIMTAKRVRTMSGFETVEDDPEKGDGNHA